MIFPTYSFDVAKQIFQVDLHKFIVGIDSGVYILKDDSKILSN